MAANPFENSIVPAKGVSTITPADGTGVQSGFPIRSIYVGGAGNIAFIGLDGVTADLPNVVAGAVYQVGMIRVLSTGTTATALRGLL